MIGENWRCIAWWFVPVFSWISAWATQPIIGDLLERNTVQLDPLNLGLLVSDNYAVMQRNGAPSSELFALGSLIKGSLRETTALPEIRVQARNPAMHLLDVLTRSADDPRLRITEDDSAADTLVE
jgi:uncharacterized NAD(P)/FAD-binding protein YdhS